jgi:hypothetical protein
LQNHIFIYKLIFICFVCRYILEARKRALAKKKKLRTLGRRARSRDSDEEHEEEDGKSGRLKLRAGIKFLTFLKSV